MKGLKEKLVRSFHKCEFKVRKHSPEILATVGVVGVVTSTVMACKATTKLSEILDDTKESIDKIKEVEQNPKYEDRYDAEDAKKDLSIVYVQSGVKIVKLYLPALAIGTASLGCLLASNNILRKRNAALSAAYMTVDKSFKEYRKRVAERFGDEIEKEIRYNIKAQQIEETVVDEDGNETTVVSEVKAADPNSYSDYARFFDESCAAWKNDPEYNLMFLKLNNNTLTIY